jgi:inner membrane protein
MDNLTHTLTAVMLSRAGLNRLSPHATALIVLAANAPDLDILSGLAGPAAELQYHRGPTHSLVGLPIVAILVTVLVRLVMRKNFSWGRVYLLSLAGVASNALFDLTNMYGVRLLWPFSERWFNADFIPIVDVWIWLLLGLGLVAPLVSRMVSSEIGAKAGKGQSTAIVVLCLLALFGFVRYVQHERAVAVLDSRIYQGQAPLRVAAMPSFVNPLRWTGLVEGREFFEVFPSLDLLSDFDPASGNVYYKPEPNPELARARELPAFRAFLSFAQWPLWSVSPAAEPEGGVIVKVVDLRFGASQSHFAVSATLDASGRVTQPSVRF